jgi:hypothetical protein
MTGEWSGRRPVSASVATMLNFHHIHRFVAGYGIALALLGSTAAAARPIDQGSRVAPAATPREDLRSPDTRDAADGLLPPWDLRSPDARDANSFYRPVPAEVTDTAPASTTGATIDWPMIFLATGGYLLAVIVAGCAFAALRAGRRRRVAA